MSLYHVAMPGWTPITLTYSDGYQAFGRQWLPSKPRGAVLYLHGIQSHGGWFEGSAGHLSDDGLAVLLPDRRGSGRNSADRGHAPSRRRLLQDGVECLDELRRRTGSPRVHVAGVSWGGKLALALYRFAPGRISGLSLIAPGLFPRVDLALGEKFRVLLSALAGGRRRFQIPLNEPGLFTRTPRWQRFIEEDPLRLRQVTAGFLIASRRMDWYVRGSGFRVQGSERVTDGQRDGGMEGWKDGGTERRRNGEKDQGPRTSNQGQECALRVFLAGTDHIIDNDRTRAFVRQLDWPGREMIEYPGAQHTLEFEEDPMRFYADLLAGIEAGTRMTKSE